MWTESTASSSPLPGGPPRLTQKLRSGPGWVVAFTGTSGAVNLGSWIWKVTVVMCPLHIGDTAVFQLPRREPSWQAGAGTWVSLENGFFFSSAGQGFGYRQEATEVSGRMGPHLRCGSVGVAWSSPGGAGLLLTGLFIM